MQYENLFAQNSFFSGSTKSCDQIVQMRVNKGSWLNENHARNKEKKDKIENTHPPNTS
jgi:hypothetical protein